MREELKGGLLEDWIVGGCFYMPQKEVVKVFTTFWVLFADSLFCSFKNTHTGGGCAGNGVHLKGLFLCHTL